MDTNFRVLKNVKSKNTISKKFAVLVLLAVAGLPVQASIPSCVLNFEYRFMPLENAGPLGTPWVVAVFENADGGVRLWVQNTSPDGTNVVQKLWFNLNPVFDPANLTFNFVGSSSGTDDWLIGTSANAYKADGDGLYDILFVHSGDQPFGAGDWFAYNISGIPNLNAFDFCYFSEPPPPGQEPYYGPYKAVALFPCFQYIAVPEPSTVILACGGLCILLGRRFLGPKS